MIVESGIVTILYSLLFTLCMALTAILCLCGCKAKERKDELVGVEGHVKMTNPDVVEIIEVNGNAVLANDAAPSVKRSLPDLPIDHPTVGNDTVSWEPGGDTTSELYATVGLQKALKNEVASSSSTKDHPYDKLKDVEHPYAQVIIGEGTSASSQAQPTAGPDVPPSPRSGPAPREIAAASAISGQVHASDDLPYMTPPAHFSGDSQDSTKGYTSISVREPLATIRAETTESQGERGQHYTTVSDDSDDMYAAIEEPASGSETYARIESAAPEQPEDPADAPALVRPAQPIADVRRSNPPPVVNTSHSRQESSSSAASTVNSPKPEKREANSPLPAPPALSGGNGEDRTLDDMYAKVNKKKRREIEETLERGASTESAVSGSSESVSYRIQSNNVSTAESSQSHSCHGQSTASYSTSSESAAAGPLATNSTHSCRSQSTTDSPSPRRATELRSDSSLSSDVDARGSCERLNDDPRYETLNRKDMGYKVIMKNEHGYEYLNEKDPGYRILAETGVDPEYETLYGNSGDPCYATLRKTGDPCYETLMNGVVSSEPNYETLGRGPPSDMDPNYERIGQPDYASLPCDGYAAVAVSRQAEPPYASVPGDVYAAVVKHKLKLADPPYASISGDSCLSKEDAPLHASEPPYESLQGENCTSEPEYESVQYYSGTAEPPYQLLADFASGSIQKEK